MNMPAPVHVDPDHVCTPAEDGRYHCGPAHDAFCTECRAEKVGPSLPPANLDPYQTTRDDQLRMYALQMAVNNRPLSGGMQNYVTNSRDASQIVTEADVFYAFLTKP